MATINTKHKMLQLAKRIANTEYKDKIEVSRDLNYSISGHSIIPASLVKQQEIDSILAEHPEFDAGEFKRMIKQAETILKEKEIY